MSLNSLLDDVIAVMDVFEGKKISSKSLSQQEEDYVYIDMMNKDNNKYIRAVRECTNYSKWMPESIMKLAQSYYEYNQNIRKIQEKVFPQYSLERLQGKIYSLKEEGKLE